MLRQVPPYKGNKETFLILSLRGAKCKPLTSETIKRFEPTGNHAIHGKGN